MSALECVLHFFFYRPQEHQQKNQLYLEVKADKQDETKIKANKKVCVRRHRCPTCPSLFLLPPRNMRIRRRICSTCHMFPRCAHSNMTEFISHLHIYTPALKAQTY